MPLAARKRIPGHSDAVIRINRTLRNYSSIVLNRFCLTFTLYCSVYDAEPASSAAWIAAISFVTSSRSLYQARNVLCAPHNDRSFPSEANRAYLGLFFRPLNCCERVTFDTFAITPSFGETIRITPEEPAFS